MNDFLLCQLQWKWNFNLQWNEMATSANNPQPPTWHASADHVHKEVNRAHKSSRTGVAVIHVSRSVVLTHICSVSKGKSRSDTAKLKAHPAQELHKQSRMAVVGAEKGKKARISPASARSHTQNSPSESRSSFISTAGSFLSSTHLSFPPILLGFSLSPSVLFSAWNSKNRSCSGWTADSKLGGEGNAIHGGNFFWGWQGFWSGQCFCYLWQLQQAWCSRPSLHLHPSC